MKRFGTDLRRYWNYAVYEAKSQLKSEVANSYLNWIWWILEPFCFMLIYAFVFGFLFQRKQELFNVYIFIALALWDFFNRCVKASVTIVRKNKSVVSKVYLPKYILIISNMLVNAFKMAVCLLISFGMLIFYHVDISLHLLELVPVLGIAVLFTFGCSCILLHIGIFVDDMSNVINILLRFVFYLTGIFYNIEQDMPKPYSTILLSCNPLALFVNALRDCMMFCKSPDWMLLLIWLLISLILSVFGVRNIYQHENTYAKVI